MARTRYPSDKEWGIVEPLIPAPKTGGACRTILRHTRRYMTVFELGVIAGYGNALIKCSEKG